MECLINGVSFEGCNSNKNVIFVDSYKEVFFDILSLELNEQTIIAELIENTKTGPYVNIKKVILNGKAYQDIKFLVIKEKADTRIHLNETKLNESAAGIDYIQPKLTPAIRVNTPVVAPNSKPVDVSARQEIERIKEQALSNIRVEKEKLLLLKEEINSANISIDGKVEEYRSELLKSFYDIADSNKNVLEKKIDIALKDATSQLQEINSTNYINHVNDIVKKHVDDIAAQYSGKEKDLLESINDKVTVDISEIANVLEGKVNLAIKTIAEDNTVTIQDKNNQIIEHVNKEITNATESLNITLENYKTHLLDNYLQTLKNSSEEFKKSTNVTVNEAVTDLQEKNQTAFNLQSNNSITKSVNDLTKIIESSKLEFGQEMRTSLREVTDDVSTKILNSFNLEKIKIDEKIEHLNAEAVDIFNNLKHNTKVSLESKIEAIDSNINSLNDTKNKFIDEVTILIEQFKTKTLQSIEAEKLIIDEKIKKLDTISKNTEDTISKLSEQVTANKEKLVDEVDTYLHEVAIANKNTVAEKIEELQKKINESLLEVNIETVYSKFIDVYGNKVDVAITEFIDSKKRLIKEELNDIGAPQPTQDFDTLIKSHWEQKEPEMMQKVKKIAATYADSYGGGGSVAVQYAKGGTMDGNLNITGMILSGGQDLSSIFSSGGGGGDNPAVDTLVTTTSADWNTSYTNLVGNSGAYLSAVDLSNIASVSSNWNTSYTFLTSNSALILGDLTNISNTSATWNNAWTNLIYNSGAYLSAVDLSNIAAVSANWNNTYTQFNSNSALYATTSYVNSNFLSLSGGTLSGTLTLYKDLSVLGNLFVTGSATFGNTIITTSSALSVVNTGPGPALYISQGPGGGDIASFYDSTNNLEVLHIGNDTPWINNKGIIGIRTSNPNETLTVIGGISATGIISTSAINSNSNNWTSSFTYANANSAKLTSSTSNYLSLSGGTLTGGLTGTTGTFSGALGVTGVATLGNGAILGTPASGVVTNLTGTASININGTVGATTPSTVAATTITSTGQATFTNSANSAGSVSTLLQNANSNAGIGARLAWRLDNLANEWGYINVNRVGGGSTAQMDIAVNGSAYAGAPSVVGTFTSTGLNSTAIGATTPSTGAFTTGGYNNAVGDTQFSVGTVAPSVKLVDNYTSPNSSTKAAVLAMATTAGHYGLADGDVMLGMFGASRGNLYLKPNYSGAGTKQTYIVSALDISGNTAITGTLAASGNISTTGGDVLIRGAAGGQITQNSGAGGLYIANTGTSTTMRLLVTNGAAASVTALTLAADSGAATFASNVAVTGTLSCTTGATFATSSGNVGIGAATVAGVDSRLRVVGGSDGNTGISMGCTATERPTVGFRVSDNSLRAKIEVNDTNGATGDRLGFFVYPNPTVEVMSLRGSGKVGIGTTSPGQLLHIQDATSYTALNVNNNKGSAGGTSVIQFGLNDASFVTPDAARIEARIIDNPHSALDFKIYNSTGAGQTIMSIVGTGSTGHVGIGTTSPSTLLDIESSGATAEISLNQTGASGREFRLGSTGSGYGTAGLFIIYDVTASAERFRINSAGALKLSAYGAGTLTTDGSGNITAVSDQRIKKNIRPFSRGLAEILAINPILHGYSTESGLDQSRDDYAGFSAQQVQPLIPEAIGVNADGMLSFSDRPVMAALVNAVKELSARLAALEAK